MAVRFSGGRCQADSSWRFNPALACRATESARLYFCAGDENFKSSVHSLAGVAKSYQPLHRSPAKTAPIGHPCGLASPSAQSPVIARMAIAGRYGLARPRQAWLWHAPARSTLMDAQEGPQMYGEGVMRGTCKPQPNEKQRGQIIVLFGLLLPVLIGFLAMGVDLGQGYLERRNNQNAADASSVVGEQAMLKVASDASVRNAIKNVLVAGGYPSTSIVFLTPTSATPGTDTTKAYVDAEYGSYSSSTATCTPLTANEYVGSQTGSPPSSATCVRVKVTTSVNTLFAKIPLIGVAQISASAQGSAGQISPGTGAGNVSGLPTPASWNTGSGEGYTIWGGNRADSTGLSVGSPVLFFADSGWNSGNDVQTNCNPCQYQATQNFKGLADPQCFTVPLPSSCTGPNGAHGNPADNLTAGSEVQVVVVSSVSHQGNTNDLTPIGLASVQVLASCPGSPAYLQTGTRGVCGTIENVDTGSLNSTGSTATPTPTSIIGNTN